MAALDTQVADMARGALVEGFKSLIETKGWKAALDDLHDQTTAGKVQAIAIAEAQSIGLKSAVYGAALLAFKTMDTLRRMALNARLKELEQRLKQLETTTTPMHYEGTHELAKTYDRGAFVTHDGSLWHCNHKTNAPPGSDASWTLAVKRGRDAR